MWKLFDAEGIVKLFDLFLVSGISEGDKSKTQNNDA
jgi:hypothetical protein